MRIVIVEDEAPIREGMEGILKKLNPSYELAGKAADGIEGLEVIRHVKPDLIIMDIRMPDMDGLTMLKKLREEGVASKALILSAYSDFSYAKQAMELGVSTYLLKPVKIQELKKVLKQMEEEVQEKNHQGTLLSLESMTRSALTGILEKTEETAAALEKKYDIKATDPMTVFIIWLGRFYDERKDIVLRILGEVDGHVQGFSSVVTAFPERTQCTMVLYHMEQDRDWEAYFNRSVVPMLLSNTDSKAVCVWDECGGFYELEESRKRIRRLLEWSLSLGNGKIISERRIADIPVYPLRYPPELSLRLKQSVIKGDEKEFKACFTEFLNYCRDQVHKPKDIKEACITFLWTALNTAREYITFEENELEVPELLEAIMNAYTWDDVGVSMKRLFDAIMAGGITGKQEVSPLIARAKRMIEEYYSQGITMEEVARKLAVSPEYLSRQFKKETGISFTEEVRNVKVEKVKTLLLGTSQNLTQIAAMTGFSDPKYMSKVFKEEVGVLPAEYRQMNS